MNAVQQTTGATEKMKNTVAELILDRESKLFTSGAGMSVRAWLDTLQGIAASVWPPILHHPK